MPNRRQFVKGSVAASIGVGAMTSISGCSQIPIIGSGGGGSYTKWLWEPGEFTDQDHYGFYVVRPKTILANEDAFDEEQIDQVEDAYDDVLDPTGVDTDEVDRIVSTNVATGFAGSFDENDVIEELEDNDFDDESETNGFTIYSTSDEMTAFALDLNEILRTIRLSESETALDVAEELVEVRSGDGSRYNEESEAMDLLTNKLYNGYQISARTHEPTEADNPEETQFENSVGIGVSGKLSGDSVTVKYIVVYEDKDDVDVDDLEDWIEAAEDRDRTAGELDDVKYSSSGRAGIVKGTMDPDEFRG